MKNVITHLQKQNWIFSWKSRMVHKMENVKLLNGHESVTSQESIEMEEYSDEEDEVFVKGKSNEV